MIKYVAYYSDYDVTSRIDEVEVERETSQSVWMDGSRSAKRSKYDNYFDTKKEAKAFLIRLQARRVKNMINQLGNAENRLADVELL